ncbi:DNA-binding FrmR family transcriptional regulator [Pullulanibacillus pueri]|uniref:Transcriptional regulator n=1 Tax=Pullulanibacillus pueri TaxID=1437324 RepID=A0A8J2ZX25_9BACL|nr:metal-sensing transcriptional repressor [Pullulanibacillus pueri]MBM7680620.1 DNA-binding FrmR family transcriptional regulator [Pullulanibacillus pueri]GGH83917.1 transcriptional regulator [Pullulanibacillus pueri]
MEKEKSMQPEKHPLLPRSEKEKQAMINRLKRVEGQIRGLQKMVEDDRYCLDILVQLSAVQAALKKVGLGLMERHTKMCVSHAIKNGDGDEYIEELMRVIQQISK